MSNTGKIGAFLVEQKVHPFEIWHFRFGDNRPDRQNEIEVVHNELQSTK